MGRKQDEKTTQLQIWATSYGKGKIMEEKQMIGKVNPTVGKKQLLESRFELVLRNWQDVPN